MSVEDLIKSLGEARHKISRGRSSLNPVHSRKNLAYSPRNLPFEITPRSQLSPRLPSSGARSPEPYFLSKEKTLTSPSRNSHMYSEIQKQLYQPKKTSPVPKSLPSYKLDGAKLLVDKIRSFLAKSLQNWRSRTQEAISEEKLVYENAKNLRIRVSSPEFFSTEELERDSPRNSARHSPRNRTPSNLSTSINVTQSLEKSTKGFRSHLSPSQRSLEFISPNRLKKNKRGTSKNAMIKVAVALIMALRRHYKDFFSALKLWATLKKAAVKLSLVLEFEVHKNYNKSFCLLKEWFKETIPERTISPFISTETPRGESNLKTTIESLQVQIKGIRDSRKKRPIKLGLKTRMESLIQSFKKRHANALINYLTNYSQQTRYTLSRFLFLVSMVQVRLVSASFSTIVSYFSSGKAANQVLKTFVKNISKDAIYRKKVCFSHWLSIADSRPTEFYSLKVITLRESLEQLTVKQCRGFFSSYRIAKQKATNADNSKIQNAHKGLKRLIPYIKQTKLKAWHRWRQSMRTGKTKNYAALSIWKVIENQKRGCYQKFWCQLMIHNYQKKTALRLCVKVLKLRFQRAFEGLKSTILPKKFVLNKMRKLSFILMKSKFSYLMRSIQEYSELKQLLFKRKRKLSMFVLCLNSHYNLLQKESLQNWRLQSYNESLIRIRKAAYRKEVNRTLATTRLLRVLTRISNHKVVSAWFKLSSFN